MRFFITMLCFVLSYSAQAAQQPPSDMPLTTVLHHVLETNPALKAARADLNATRELYPQATANWKPTLDGEASLYSTDIENSNFGGADGATTKDLTLTLEQPLFRGGRTVAETARAESAIASAEAQVRQIEQNLLLAAAEVYMNVARDRKLYELQKRNFDFVTQEFQATREKLEAGMLTVTDLKQAESRRARARAEKAAAAGQLKSSNAAFEELIGFSPVHTLYYPRASMALPGALDSLIVQAEKDSPDILAATHTLEAAEHNIDATFREHFPQIFAFASYNKQYDPQPGIIDDSEVKTIGVRASMPFYDGGVIRSRTRQATSTAEQRREQIEEARRRVHASLTDYWSQLEAAQAEISARHLEIEAAELAREGVREEAQLGTRTVLDILDADLELLESQAALVNARRDEIMARYGISATLGRLPNF